MIDLDLPPRQGLPDDLRNQMLVELRRLLDQPAKRSKTPYAVAAGVAALVAGGVVAATVVQGGSTPEPVAGTGKLTGDKGVTAQAKRCQAASKKDGGFPGNADWRVVTYLTLDDHTTIAFKVGADRPVFCNVTGTLVELSRYDATPKYAEGTKTGALMLTKGSNVLGVAVDPAAKRLDAFEASEIDSDLRPDNHAYKTAEHMVLWSPEYPNEPRTVSQDRAPQVPLPDPSGTTVTVVDRPYTGPPPDRTSPGGKLLAQCIATDGKAGFPLTDPDTWQPGPMITGDTHKIVVMRGTKLVTICGDDGIPNIALRGGPLRVAILPKGNRPVMAMSGESLVRGGKIKDLVYGAVTMDAASMTLITREHKTVTAQVDKGMFLAETRTKPAIFGPDDSIYPEVTSVTVKDAHGKVLYHGKPEVSPDS